MEEKKTLHEIITGNLEGTWCEGITILDVSCNEISFDNIYSNNGKELMINKYLIPMNEKVFSKVIEMDYKEAIKEFNLNNKSIISPKVSTDEIITFDGFRHIEYGGNVYCHTHTENKGIIVNDKDTFHNFDEILELGFISEKEKMGKWLVF